MKKSSLWIVICLTALIGCSGRSPEFYAQKKPTVVADNDGDSPLKLVGERLFRETRFSQYFMTHSHGHLNQPPVQGDPVVDQLRTLSGLLPNPYHGQAISCAACHFVDQTKTLAGAGSRAYTDFFVRSPIPERGDGQHFTARNAPNMVASSISSKYLLHWDGRFASPEDLVRGTYLGRNLGWLPGEEKNVIHHMAEIIRQDNGQFVTDPGENRFRGYSYRRLFLGDASVPSSIRIPVAYRMNISGASDEQIFDGVINLLAGYLRTLDFAKDRQGRHVGSPFDVFLRKNHLPQEPSPGESPETYSARLLSLLDHATHLDFVSNRDGRFILHHQNFEFGPQELAGYRVFAGRGKCIACHAAPDFTDHGFHNTGVSQADYDEVHGEGSFMKLAVPTLSQRGHEVADMFKAGEFESAPSGDDPFKADLGAWNVLGDPTLPHPQAKLRTAICKALNLDCDNMGDAELLPHAIGMVKTPTLRDLGQSQPYMHTGQMATIEDVLKFYVKYSELARQGRVRNADPRLKNIDITPADYESLTRFLKSLNEDYD